MTKAPVSIDNIETVLASGDLSRLTPEERVAHIARVCESLGLNVLTRPFEYQTFQGKLVLYARKDATEQLRKIHRVSVTDIKKEVIEGMLHTTVFGEDSTGRRDFATGIVPIAGLKGVDLANAYLKCETKAKRRFTLSICGLGILDESELGDMRAQPPRDVRAKQIEERLSKEPPPEIEIEAEPDFMAAAATSEPEPIGEYVVKVGVNKGKRLKDIPRAKIENFILWAREQKDLGASAKEYLDTATAYLEGD